MPVLTRYLSRLFLARNITISLAMVAILGVLDALSKGDVLPVDAGILEHLKFMGLRAPLIFEQVFIFAFLLSLLVTYVALIRRNELVAVVYSGMSAWRQIAALAPAVLAITVFYVALIDQATPRAQQALLAWLGPKAVVKNATLAEDLWISDGAMIVRIKSVQEDKLQGLTLFERRANGKVSAVNFATSAEAGEKGWHLSGVHQIRYDGEEIDPPEFWNSGLDAQTLRLLALEPRYLSVVNLWELSKLEGSGNRVSTVYQMWIYSRAVLPIAALGFLIVTVLTMQRFGRDAQPELLLVATMAGGFLYVIFDSITKTLPENTTMSSMLFAFAPLACLFVACLVLALRKARA